MNDAQKQDWQWGIIGTGAIADKFAKDLAHVPNAHKAVVYSRSSQTGRMFAKQHGFEASYDNLSDFLAHPQLDIVYIATPHIAHLEQALAAIKAGKAVLIEKPIAMTAGQTTQIKEAARKNKILVMEGLWSRFLPAVQNAKTIIESGEIGKLEHARASLFFDRAYDPAHRLFSADLGGGVLHDLGVYPVSLARYFFGHLALAGSTWSAAPNGVNTSASLKLTGGDVEIDIDVGFGPERGNTFDIFGSKGALRIDRHFLRADSLTLWKGPVQNLPAATGGLITRFINKFSLHGGTRKSFVRGSLGLNFQAAAMQAALGQKLHEHPVMPLNESIEILRIIEQVLEKPASA